MTGQGLQSGRPATTATARRERGRSRVGSLTALVAAAGLTGTVVVAGTLAATTATGASAQHRASSRSGTPQSGTPQSDPRPDVSSGSTHTHATSSGS